MYFLNLGVKRLIIESSPQESNHIIAAYNELPPSCDKYRTPRRYIFNALVPLCSFSHTVYITESAVTGIVKPDIPNVCDCLGLQFD